MHFFYFQNNYFLVRLPSPPVGSFQLKISQVPVPLLYFVSSTLPDPSTHTPPHPVIHTIPFTAPKTVTALIFSCGTPLNTKTIYFFLHNFSLFFQLFLQLSSAPFLPVGSAQLNSFSSLPYFYTFYCSQNHCHAFLPCVLAASHTPFSFHSNRPRPLKQSTFLPIRAS